MCCRTTKPNKTPGLAGSGCISHIMGTLGENAASAKPWRGHHLGAACCIQGTENGNKRSHPEPQVLLPPQHSVARAAGEVVSLQLNLDKFRSGRIWGESFPLSSIEISWGCSHF